MAFTPIGFCIELVIEGTQFGEERRTVLHAVQGSTVTDPDVDDAAAAVGAWLASSGVIHLFSPTVTFQGIKATDISVAGGYQSYFNMANQAGEATGNSLPGNVSCCMSLHTGHPGRSGRGRIYHYGMTTPMLDTTDGSLVDSSSLGALHSGYLDLISAFDSISPKLAVASRKLGVAYTVTTITADNKIDSQKRRLAGRGR